MGRCRESVLPYYSIDGQSRWLTLLEVRFYSVLLTHMFALIISCPTVIPPRHSCVTMRAVPFSACGSAPRAQLIQYFALARSYGELCVPCFRQCMQ